MTLGGLTVEIKIYSLRMAFRKGLMTAMRCIEGRRTVRNQILAAGSFHNPQPCSYIPHTSIPAPISHETVGPYIPSDSPRSSVYLLDHCLSYLTFNVHLASSRVSSYSVPPVETNVKVVAQCTPLLGQRLKQHCFVHPTSFD
jgi:hypothetical protein